MYAIRSYYVSKLWGVGPACEAQLQRLGIRTIAQLRVLGKDVLEHDPVDEERGGDSEGDDVGQRIELPST